MNPIKCVKLDECRKIKMVLDKDLFDFQYAESIKAVCKKCKEGVKNVTGNTKVRLA